MRLLNKNFLIVILSKAKNLLRRGFFVFRLRMTMDQEISYNQVRQSFRQLFRKKILRQTQPIIS